MELMDIDVDIFMGRRAEERTFEEQIKLIVEDAYDCQDENLSTLLHDKIQYFTNSRHQREKIQKILVNTMPNKDRLIRCTAIYDLEEVVRYVLMASDMNHPWYLALLHSRYLCQIYSDFDETMDMSYFKAKTFCHMLEAAMAIRIVLTSAEFCIQDTFTNRYMIKFHSLSDLCRHNFEFKVSRFNERFIFFEGVEINVRPLTAFDIQLLKYLIEHCDSNPARTIYQLLAALMQSEQDVTLAHNIGWFSNIPWEIFTDAHQRPYQMESPTCDFFAHQALVRIHKHRTSFLRSFKRDIRRQLAASPATIWIAAASLIFTFVSVVQFFMGLQPH
ncbi:hypothetical protein BGZ94_005092 [Podila epigama]|nr:hypothetical protein BGZ94_005092 [Podila epigama]